MNFDYLKKIKDELKKLQDELWDYSELAFGEYKSSEALASFLEKNGFEVTRNVAQMETAFTAVIGQGKPVICILAEYDALDGLSQKADIAEYCPIENKTSGHGCGHHLLAVGSVAAAMLVKNYFEENDLKGTVKLVGCPAEEAGSGKVYLTREGFFKDCDIALTWHPDDVNAVMMGKSQSCISSYFRFHGKASHAAAAPHLGRSALDAVELMNVGVNYLREHMEKTDSIHYAITNTGGISPNVVQSEAEVYYFVRSISGPKCKALYERVKNVAKGASLMTETELETVFDDGLLDVIPNSTLQQILIDCLNEVGVNQYTEEEREYAQKFKATVPASQIENAEISPSVKNSAELKKDRRENPLCTIILQPNPVELSTAESTDVGDVSWVVPTAQITTACYSYGTPGHSWQLVAQGKSSVAFKGAMLAGKVLALAVEKILKDPSVAEKAKKELAERLAGQKYECLIPEEIKPHKYS